MKLANIYTVVRHVSTRGTRRRNLGIRKALAGHEVSRIVSCIVAKRADETAYSGNLLGEIQVEYVGRGRAQTV